jgi:YHS domain-containing protein
MPAMRRLVSALLRIASIAIIAVVTGCASNRVISDGPHHNLMLKGYDPVAYFTDGKPVPGKVDIAARHDGLDYRFASEEHKRMFLADPQHYVPKYGGFCAQGAAYAVMFGGEAEKFQIIDGRLFIYGDQGAIDAWNSSPKKHLEYADHYWETEMKGMPYRLQTLKRFVFKVPHYKTGREVRERLAAGKPVLE